MKKIVFGVLLVLISAVNCFAWDPSGAWSIEGRGDYKIEISCKGGACSIKAQSTNGSKYKANGFVKGDKLFVAYDYLTETAFGFISYVQQGENSMTQKTFDTNGKEAWSGRLLRQ